MMENNNNNLTIKILRKLDLDTKLFTKLQSRLQNYLGQTLHVLQLKTQLLDNNDKGPVLLLTALGFPFKMFRSLRQY